MLSTTAKGALRSKKYSKLMAESKLMKLEYCIDVVCTIMQV